MEFPAGSAGAAGAQSSDKFDGNKQSCEDLLIPFSKKDFEESPDHFGYCKIPANGPSMIIASIESAIKTNEICGFMLQASSQDFDKESVSREFGGGATLDIVVATHPPSEGGIILNYQR